MLRYRKCGLLLAELWGREREILGGRAPGQVDKRKGPPNRLSPGDGFLLFWELRLPVRLFHVFPYVSYHLFWISQHFPLCPSVWIFSTDMFKFMIFSSAASNLPFKPSTDLFLFLGRGGASWGMGELCSPTKDWTHPPAVEVQNLNCWTARKFYIFQFYNVCLILLKLHRDYFLYL